MSKILRRPMFRGGGSVDSRGTGITSGLDKPKRGLVDEPGGYSGFRSATEIYSDAEKQVPAADPPKLSIGDYLRIAASGMQILGAPGEGPGIRGALTASAKPLANLGVSLGDSIDLRRAKSLERREGRVRDMAELETGLEVAKIKSQGDFEKRRLAFNAFYDVKLAKAKTPEERAKVEADRARDYDFYIIKGGDASDILRLATEEDNALAARKYAESKAANDKLNPGDAGYQEALVKYTAEYYQILGPSIAGSPIGKRTPKAEGGAIQDPTIAMESEARQVPMSYDELRSRLPATISDDIVRLLSTSYEALADFAEIQTQSDVDNFNLKYQVQLVLPQEA